jgi:hypothetical protein
MFDFGVVTAGEFRTSIRDIISEEKELEKTP